VCIATSFNKSLTDPTLLHGITPNKLIKEKNKKFLIGSDEFNLNKYNYILLAPTLFGEEKYIISEFLYNYLSELSFMNKDFIFSYPLDSLSRCLRANIKKSEMTIPKRNISFSTFIVQSHDVIGHRSKLRK